MSLMRSIKEFVRRFTQTFNGVNILINNACITTQKREITADGVERTIGTDFIGPHILTKLLLPYFKSDGDNRIIIASSYFYGVGKFTIKKINDYCWIKAYTVSKYALLLMTLELSDKLKDIALPTMPFAQA